MDGKQYEVIGQVLRDARDETVDLRNLYVTTEGQPPVVLDKLVRVTETSSPPQIYRFDRYESATVSAALAPGRTIGDGIEAMDAIARDVLDEDFATTLAGESRDFAESATSLAFVFVLALLLVYLVLAAQFESFRDPLIIMFTVPLALAGALLALWYFNQTINIFSQIGMIMLIGLVTKNGILIVEFANQRKAAGSDVMQAIVEGATARFRPVLMTSLSTVLGILPIALGLGAGAESRIPMGVAVIGGLLIGTLLTLFVIPAMMSFLTSRHGRVQRFAS
jgi:multidrug efflux pump